MPWNTQINKHMGAYKNPKVAKDILITVSGELDRDEDNIDDCYRLGKYNREKARTIKSDI